MSFDMPNDQPADKESYEQWEREQKQKPVGEPSQLPLDGEEIGELERNHDETIKCARTACPSVLNVVCVHTQTGRRYCPRCARRINESSPGLVTFPKHLAGQSLT